MAKNIINGLSQGTILHGKSYDYKIVKALGQGSFGITYLASVKMRGELGSIDANVHVAIKEFFMHEINGREGSTVTSGSKTGLYDKYKDKFNKEAINLSKLHHDNIIRVVEAFEANNTVYYAMEFADGGSLDDLIQGHKRLKEGEALGYALQIGKALSFMHSKKMLHLDLKPSNVMLHDGKAVLIDFGLSKQFDEDGNPESSTTIGGGTQGYAPLEQANYKGEKKDVLPVTMDIYAFGATMFKMLTGHKPPVASDVLNEGFPAGDLTAKNVSPELIGIIERAMAPLRKNRFQSMDEVLRKLGSLVDTSDNDDTDGTSIDDDDHSSRQKPLPPTPPPIPPIGDTLWSKILRYLQKSWKHISIIATLIAIVVVVINWPQPGPVDLHESEQTNSIEVEEVAADVEEESNHFQQSGRQRESFTVNGVSFNMVRVEGGTFQMGATSEQKDPYDNEKPVHSVTLSSYYIGETEVTQALWQAVMGNNPSNWKGDNLPVEEVSWDDCQEFINKLNSLTHRNFRLPTEAEWEFAARGGTKSRGYQYSGSNTIGNVAWYDDNSGGKTHPVKTKAANELDLYDMTGNVWEWCADWHGSYSSGSQTNPTGPSSGSRRVRRGGSWGNYARICRVADRNDGTPGHRYGGLGLRLAL